jgi:hypothetical protein
MKPVEALALVGGYVDEELLTRNEYLAAENEILCSKIDGKIKLTHEERIHLAKIGQRIGKKALEDVANIVKPETVLKWYRDLVAKKFDSSANRTMVGRPPIDKDIEDLILLIAEANPDWGYDRIMGALSNLGLIVSDQTVGNILKEHGIPPAPKRQPSMPWADFVKFHEDVLSACDFFTAEVFTPFGLITYYVLSFIQVGSRKVHLAGITPNPDEVWMKRMAINITMEDWGCLDGQHYLIMDRDTKFCAAFRRILNDAGVKPIRLPIRSPNLNTYSERFVLSAKSECISKLVFFGEQSLWTAMREYLAHYHEERNHQGKDNLLLFPAADHNTSRADGEIQCRERLGGLLKYCCREAA